MSTKPMKQIQKTGALRNWLDAIKASNSSGLLKSADIVEAARDKNSPGHEHFTWNDSEAARKCRLAEANQLIRTVYVVDASDGNRQPAFVSLLSDREKPGGGYRATSDVLSSQALRNQLELTAKAELRGWTERYQMLTKLVNGVAKAAGLVPVKARRKQKAR